jgi:hypothetical protein
MKIRSRIVLILIALLVLLGTGIAVYWRITPSNDAWVAANELKDSTTFGFGPRGATAHIADDENRFFRILQSPKSHLVFRHLYDTGTQEAKAFAIVGLRQTTLGRFDSRIDDFARSTTTFFTLSGCEGGDCTPKAFVANWDQDSFLRYVQIFR